MNYKAKLIVLLFTVFMVMSKAYSQDPTDPGIVTLMSPSSVVLGSTGILSANVGNYGTETIVANSLRVTISVGLDAEILGIAPGSDSRWTQLGLLTPGSGNTILLTNTAGGFGASDVGAILLTVKGTAISGPDIIQSNIVYITAANPLLCDVPNCNPVPLNASQGNASTSNDNHQTSLAVTAAPGNVIDAVDDPALGSVNGTMGGSAGDVTINDTLNGAPVTQANTDVTPGTNGPLSIDANGIVSVVAGTPPGSYSIIYQICEASNLGNCDTATATVTVFCGQIAAPTASVTAQPTCTLATGTITVTSPVPGAEVSYTVTGTNPVVAAQNNATGVFSGLASGDYSVTTTKSGCTSPAISLAVNPRPINCINAAGIFHTTVSCSDYRNNIGSQVGQLCYTTKSNKVFNVTPGQFFYFTSITAPSASFCVDIVETKSCSGLALFGVNQNNQIALFNANCSKVASGAQISLGLGSVCITNATPGAQYVLAVKYNSKSIVGSTFTGSAPVCQYTFESKINGTTIAGSSTSINLVPNCSSTAKTEIAESDDFEVTLAPNPSSNDFGLYIKSLGTEELTVRIIDINGRIIRQFNSIPQETIRFGNELNRGFYFIEVSQGIERKVLKVQKL